MKIYRREDTALLPIPPAEAWDFFSNPANLEKLTPADMGFENAYPLDAERVYPGMVIVHRVRPLAGIKLTWVTVIEEVVDGVRFIDAQRKGPFGFWHHIHEFEPRNGGAHTLVKDTLYYGLPFGVLGRLAHAIQVKRQVQAIFAFRKEKMKTLFGKQAAPSAH